MMSVTNEQSARIGRPRSNPGVAIDDFVRYLITNSPQTPCEAIANVYQEVVPNEKRFQTALNVILPFLSAGTESSSRIAAAYVLYSLYSSYPISVNPFHSVLLEASEAENRLASEPSLDKPAHSRSPQFVWVLSKILADQGKDLKNERPQTLSIKELVSLGPPSLQLLQNGESTIQASAKRENSDFSVPKNVHDESLVDMEACGTELARAIQLMLNARNRVLTLSEQRTVKPHLSAMVLPVPLLEAVDLSGLTIHNPDIAYRYLVLIVSHHIDIRLEYMSALGSLPPILPAFDVIGRLLKDSSETTLGDSRSSIAEFVRSHVLGAFIHFSIEWIERRENKSQEQGMGVLDDSLDKATENLCRFYRSLISAMLVDTTSDIDTTEMAHFALQHSRLGEANALYRILALART